MPQGNRSKSRRPYLLLSIDDIEKIALNHWGDKGFLVVIKEELVHRKTSKAKKLLEEIKGTLSKGIEILNKKKMFCEKCGDLMEIKFGKLGMFWQCVEYPSCKNTVKITRKDW